ncbi:hypothetical protein LTR97_010471 [Elasticomyces elasticus]|uniref:Uncharacterized protein n=1 Tax=Elasticomyces elasticus TaxID=574655 RepID=A0AAN7VU40_9PEZI|nr:hypothetical protein LTR97_010471 [Elasticomyces elasticus]
MADDALRCLQAFLQSVPAWIADIESILAASQAQHETSLSKQQPAETALHEYASGLSAGSLPSTHQTQDRGEEERHKLKRSESQASLLRPQLPHMTVSDALRLSQRKRKTSSVCSGDQSGPCKYRSRAMTVVYYDGNTQKRFEKLVGDIGSGRNAVKKATMGTGVARLSRERSNSSSDGSSGGEDGEDTLDLKKLQYKTTRQHEAYIGPGSEAFDKIDKSLDLGQSLCERAAHQILRDGDCALELSNAKKHLADAKEAAEGALPHLEESAQQTLDRQRRHGERQRVKDNADEESKPISKPIEPVHDASPVPSLVSSRPSDAKLEVDLEADDEESDDDEGAFTPEAFRSGKFQIPRTRLMAH